MTHAAAIIADDLTGALDSAAPFAARGLRTVVALEPAALGEALATGAAVVAVNTLSRHLRPEAAAAVAGDAARRCLASGARLLLKKIDSRLRGHVGPEVLAVARAQGAGTLVVAPGVPSQGRIVEREAVRGAGVEAADGIAIRDRFAMAVAAGLEVEIPDQRTEEELGEIAASCVARGARVLPVGAHGIASALARHLRPESPTGHVFAPGFPALVAVGSQDPATAAQVETLRRCPAGVAVVDAPGGRVTPPPASAPASVTVLRSLPGGAPASDAAERFAAGCMSWLGAIGPRTLIVTGGDTAASLLRHLGCRVLELGGEAAPGIPWSRSASGLTVITKSGGFGHESALVELLHLRGPAAH